MADTSYSIKERIDILIDHFLPFSLAQHERWRRSGLFDVVRFCDLIQHPAAQTYTERKRVGVPGNFWKEMTAEQSRRAYEQYQDIIEAWGCA